MTLSEKFFSIAYLAFISVMVFATLALTGCEHLPSGSSIGIEFQIGGKPPTAQQAKDWRKVNEPVLINGEPVERKAYPHVVRIFVGSGSCTASVVGKRVILTAAHCGETGDVAKFQTWDGKQYAAKLTRAPGYPGNDLDLMLGITSVDIAVPPVSVRVDKFERKGMEVVMIGYGCTKPGGGGGNDGVLRMGKSKIVAGQGYDLVLENPGGSALCYGDSGGPLHWMGDDGKLVQIGVNSKGNIEDRSYCTRTTLPDSAAFLKNWSEKNSAPICGVTQDCGGSQPQPGPKSFKFENDAVSIEGFCK